MAQAPRALGYFREDSVSRTSREAHRPENRADTLAEQNRAFLEFCRREGYEVASTFLDTGADGAEQAGFRQLTEYLRRHRSPDWVVVVASVDRLGPEPTRAAKALFQLDGLGARLVTLNGDTDPTRTLLGHWSKREASPGVGERVREAMRKKAIRGEVLGRPPYGYRVSDKHRLEPVPDEAGVIRYIFRLYTREGLGIRLIARRLNEEGLRTRKGGNWSMITIRDILLNRAYLGTYTRFGVRVPGSHQALISPDDFRRVQDRMASRRTGGGERHVRQFLASGLAFCGYCGNKMIGVSRRQTWTRRGDGGAGEAEYRYYQCLTRTNQSMCDYHTWRADDLEQEVRAQAITGLQQAIAAPDSPDAAGAAAEEEAGRLRQRLRQLDRRLEQYLEAAANHEITVGRLRELSIELTQEQLETDEAIAQIEGRRRLAETLSHQRKQREQLLRRLQAGWDALDFEARQTTIREVVDRVTVLDDGCLVRLRT